MLPLRAAQDGRIRSPTSRRLISREGRPGASLIAVMRSPRSSGGHRAHRRRSMGDVFAGTPSDALGLPAVQRRGPNLVLPPVRRVRHRGHRPPPCLLRGNCRRPTSGEVYRPSLRLRPAAGRGGDAGRALPRRTARRARPQAHASQERTTTRHPWADATDATDAAAHRRCRALPAIGVPARDMRPRTDPSANLRRSSDGPAAAMLHWSPIARETPRPVAALANRRGGVRAAPAPPALQRVGPPACRSRGRQVLRRWLHLRVTRQVGDPARRGRRRDDRVARVRGTVPEGRTSEQGLDAVRRRHRNGWGRSPA